MAHEEDRDITLKMVMDQLQLLQIQMNKRFDEFGTRMDGFENRMDRMERNLTRQIDAIDGRLDEIEIALLPKRVTKLEQAVFGQVA